MAAKDRALTADEQRFLDEHGGFVGSVLSREDARREFERRSAAQEREAWR
jgi:hypothetical protein